VSERNTFIKTIKKIKPMRLNITETKEIKDTELFAGLNSNENKYSPE
jgi:hypothetical protein